MKKLIILLVICKSNLFSQWSATPQANPILNINSIARSGTSLFTNQNAVLNGGNLYINANRGLVFGTNNNGEGEWIRNTRDNNINNPYGLSFFGNYAERMRLLTNGALELGVQNPNPNVRLDILNLGGFGGTFTNNGERYISLGHNNINSPGSNVLPNNVNYYGLSSTWNSDRLFVGVESIGVDRSNGLINWGDNIQDILVFRHSDAATNQNFDVASMWTGSRSRFGPTLTVQPSTTVEIEQGNGLLSGLRFMNLANNTATSNLWTNTSNRFLTVDNNGNVVLSQGSTPNNWDINGNTGISNPTYTNNVYGNISGGNFIGTINNAAFAMATNKIERMRISETGNVGIGTANPDVKLQVRDGDVRLDDVATTTSTNGSLFFGGTTYNGNNGLRMFYFGRNANLNSYTGTMEVKTTANALNNDGIAFRADRSLGTTERMRILSSNGNIGIGTANPDVKLQVRDGDVRLDDVAINTSTNGSLFFGGTTYNGQDGLRMFYFGRNANLNSYTGTLEVKTTANALNNDGIAFRADRVNGGLERMRILSSNGFVGIGNNNPQNRLEIRAEDMNSANQNDNTGKSGLRFRNLTTKSPSFEIPTANRVLSVNNDGDVILVDVPASPPINANNGCSIESGNVVLGHLGGTGTGGNLLSDREIPMEDFGIHLLSNRGSADNSLSIGLDNYWNSRDEEVGILNAHANSKLDRVGLSPNGARTGTINNRIGVYANSTRTEREDNINAYGVFAEATNLSACLRGSTSVGINGVGHNGELAIGVRGEGVLVNDCPNTTAIGGSFHSVSGGNASCIGTFTESGNSNIQNIGVLADGGAFDVNNISLPTNDFAGWFNGDIFTTGSYWPSDKNLKDNQEVIPSVSKILKSIAPYKYKYKELKEISLPQNEQFGFLAQDVEEVLPTLVRTSLIPRTETKIKMVNYQGFIPLLWRAAQEHDARILEIEKTKQENISLKEEINSLREKLLNHEEKFALLEKSIALLCESGCGGLKSKNESNKENVDKLYQSIPNPTDGEALINYYLAREYSSAYITISTLDGKEKASYKLNHKIGDGSIKVNLGDFSNGTYIYSLVAGESVIDSKKLQILK